MKHPPFRGVYPVRMKTRFFLMALAASLVLPLSADEKTETPLGKQMESFNDAFKAFRKETDPAKCAALAREAQAAVVKTLTETPELVKKMADGPEKAKAAAEYRKMMGKVYVSLCELEEAYLNGKVEDANKILGSMREMKKAGHDKFMEEE
jgi:soluble cytochrome b562